MITLPPNLWAMQKDLVNNGVLSLTGSGAPTSGTSGTGVLFAGLGSTYVDNATGNTYFQAGTLASPLWQLVDGPTVAQQLSGTIASADITGTGAGQFGHANGVILLPAPGAHVVYEFISCAFFSIRNTAAYGGGGNITVNNGGGGSALSGLVSAANTLGNAASKAYYFVPLSTVAIPFVENGPINLVSSAAFTQPGTAAGTIRWYLNYRVYSTGF